MPFCQLPNDVALHYITTTPRGDVSDLNPDRPTVLLFPPNLMDVTWLREQLRDPRLSSQYNLIAIDLRHLGESVAPFNAKHDPWVDAADVAVVHEVLQLPPCHLFASGTESSASAAMCFAALFPEKSLSLFTCKCPIRRRDLPDWAVKDQRELLELWCFPPDLETFHEACEILVGYFFNDRAATELQTELVTWWQTHYSPIKRSSFLHCSLRCLHRPEFSDKELQAIRVPSFFVQGDMTVLNSPEYARSLSDKIQNSKFLVVKGGPECLAIIPQYASVINRVLAQFLGSLSHSPARRGSPPDPEGICRNALARLAAFVDDSDIAQRDPTTTISFSCANPENVNWVNELFNRCSQGEKYAVDALNQRGEPILKFSEIYEAKFTEYIKKAKIKSMPADAEIVTVESTTVLETDSET